MHISREPGAPDDVKLGYRSYFSVRRDDEPQVVDAALAQLTSWLRRKGYDVDAMRENQHVAVADGVTAALFRIGDRDGSTTVKASVIEANQSDQTWVSELTVHAPGRMTEPVAVLLDISGPVQPSTPRLARLLTGALPARDSNAVLTDYPIKVSVFDVEDVANAVCDPDRRGLLFIAGMNAELPFDKWYNYVTGLLNQTTGLAAAYFLDPASTHAFREMLGETHAVAPGTVRTFLPGADSSSELDALRHRILSTDRIIRDSSHRLARVLGRRAQEETLQAELPAKMRRVQRRIADYADELLLTPVDGTSQPSGSVGAFGTSPAGITETSPQEPTVQKGADTERLPTTPTSGLERLVQGALSIARRVLAIDEPSESHWEQITEWALRGRGVAAAQERASRQLARLRDELETHETREIDLLSRLQDEQLEHAAAVEQLDTAERRNAYLENLVRRSLLAAELYADTPEQETSHPEDFEELITKLTQLTNVVFSGDPELTLGLDQHDPLGVWAGKAWQVLLALDDYAAASQEGRHSGDVESYLRNVPDGCRGYSMNKHAHTESEDVQKNRKLREARILPVPTAVDASGRKQMMAHFKIAQSGLISPRLHYHDDTARSGKVYVGYLGPHLPTKRTN